MKDYKRLTKRGTDNNIILMCNNCPNNHICPKDEEELVLCVQSAKDKLAELEDKIENGTLIELRDKEENLIGQQVYAIDICSYPEGEVVTNFEEDEDEIIIGFTSNEIVTVNTTRGCNMYHKNGLWFLTKVEAEKKLKEIIEGEKQW